MTRLLVYRYDLADAQRMYKGVELIRADADKVKTPGCYAVSKDEDERFASSLSRTKRRVMDLVLCNKFDYFCTFTFSSDKVDRYDYKAVQQRLCKYFNNFRSRYAPDFKYLVIPEYHKDGAVHFHGFVSGFPVGELQQNVHGYLDWPRYQSSNGFFSCSPICDYQACAAYVTKYVTKELLSMPKGIRLILRSKGLKMPERVVDEDNVRLPIDPQYSNMFCNIANIPFDLMVSTYGWL